MTSFTPEQTAFINHQSGNALCVAGAGTGKTTTLVGLIANKLDTVPANEMLVMMFNRDIRIDFQAKLQAKGINSAVPVHTFHSFCMQLLKQTGYLNETGFQLSFNEGDRDKTIAKSILRTVAAGEKSYQRQQLIKDPKTIELLMSFIGLVKAYMLPPKEVFEMSDINREYLFIIDAYWQFETIRKEQKLLFFDDWLVESVHVLKTNTNIRDFYHQRFKFIVVDEFQDINTAQYWLLKHLLAPNAQLVAVGDVDQCIYKWRGSAPQFMLNFDEDFAPATTYTLSRTFRFGHSLALSASHLISNNKQRFHDFLTVSHDNVDDTLVEVIGSERQVGEIVQSIQQYLAQGGKPSEVAILVRRWSQTLLFELAFLTKQIPYQMPVPSVLAHSREVKLLLDVMSLATGRFNENEPHFRATSLFNLLCFPHCYVPNAQLRPICDELANMSATQWELHAKKLEKAKGDGKLDTLIERVNLLARLQQKGSVKAVSVYRQYRAESQLDAWIWKTESTASEIEEAIERLDSIETVLDSMDQDCGKALQYFEYYSQKSASNSRGNSYQNLSSNPSSSQQQQQQQGVIGGGEEAVQPVQLTTIFRAKGCEYNHVYLPYWDKDAFPYVNRSSAGISADTEEERRLAYVGITRAKEQAKIYYTVEPVKKGTYVRPDKNASQFVLEANMKVAQALGPMLYEAQPIPYHKSPIAQGYCKHLGRLDDMAEAPPEPVITAPSVKEGYSYKWAIEQPIPPNGEKLIRSMVKTKTIKYLETELARVLRDLKSAIKNEDDAKQKVLVNRLIVIARAKGRRY